MRIALFGATGGTGKQIVAQATAAGHEICALVRNPGKLEVTDPRVHIIQGNVLDAAAVEATVTGADAVVVTLGNTPNNPDYVVSSGTAVVIDAMRKAGVRRLVVVSSLGVGDSRQQVPLAFRLLMSTLLRKEMEDKERQEKQVTATDLDWIIVRPGGLTDGPLTGHTHTGIDGALGEGRVSRADVAAFVLQQLSDDTYLRQTPAVT